jgi:hypothetical protein
MGFRTSVFRAVCWSTIVLGCSCTAPSDPAYQSAGATGSGGSASATASTGGGAHGGEGGVAGSGGSAGAVTGTGGALCTEAPLVELNADNALAASTNDSSSIFAFAVTFEEAWEIHRVELLTGDASNDSDYTLFVEIRADELGKPGDAVVAPGVSTSLGTAVGWYGVDISWSAQASTPYWIVFDLGGPNGPIQMPWSDSGDTFVTYWGYNGYGNWSPQSPSDLAWIARFIGCK